MEYKFQYYTASNALVVDDINFTAKVGPFVKRQFTAHDLQYFYVFTNKQYQALYITYQLNGKAKKVQLYSNLGEPAFAQMVQFLEQKYKSHSLQSLSQDEALKTMHVANPNKWVPPFVFILLAGIMSLFLYPGLRHYFDSGSVTMSIEQLLANPSTGSRNIVIKGYPLDAGVKETITSSRSSSKTSSTYIPLVGEAWQDGDPVKVVLEFSELSSSGYDEVMETMQFTGVIRNVAWEGISSDNVDFLKKEFKLNIPETPLLIEVTGTLQNDRWVIWVWGAIIIFVFILVIIVARRMR